MININDLKQQKIHMIIHTQNKTFHFITFQSALTNFISNSGFFFVHNLAIPD